MSCNLYLFFNFFIPKAYFLKVLHWALFIWTLRLFLLGVGKGVKDKVRPLEHLMFPK